MKYTLNKSDKILFPEKANSNIIPELFSNYTYGTEWDIDFSLDNNCIKIGKYTEADYGDCEYVINITSEGVYIGGRDYSCLMHGFIAFLDRIKYSPEDDSFFAEACNVSEKPDMEFRSVHLCVFPETKLWALKKYVRSCAVARYSHIILEFWGMVKYDCMKELAWPFAYSKDEIRDIVKEANALGVEIIPMFNHFGHASGSRECHGKHVVLDQNPKYEYLFDSYGWIWNISRPDVRELLSKIRSELIDVCGEGEYFHLGCDEAYLLGQNEEKAISACDYLNELQRELKAKGRRAIIWGDMLLDKHEFTGYFATSEKQMADIFTDRLSKDILIADWQYFKYEGECDSWITSEYFKEKGFDVVCCPWDNIKNIASAISTIKQNNLYGIMHTTWNTLSRGYDDMVYAGVGAWGHGEKDRYQIMRFYTANVSRKVMPVNGNYEMAGWSEKQTGPGL